MITVYTLAYNEEVMIQFLIDHYRERFSGCRIVVDADSMTTDKTVEIARANGCEVRFHTANTIRDEPLTQIKNNCWKDAKTDWVLVCDTDELVDINAAALKKEEATGTSIIRSEVYIMVAMNEKLDLAGMKYGAQQSEQVEEKCLLFNKKYIREINYGPGAHQCNPQGSAIVYSSTLYKLYHYCYIQYAATVEKYRVRRARMTPEDIKDNVPFYHETPEQIRALYTESRKKAIKVR